MSEAVSLPDFNSPIVNHARKDFPLLDAGMTVEAALERIRREGVGERVIYFFATDAERRLVGVLPTRRLLAAALQTRLEEIMVRRVVAIPASATVLEACEFFVLYKFFAFPVVDRTRRVVGVVDVSLFADEMLEAGDREEQRPAATTPSDDVFEALGFRLTQIRAALRPGAFFATAFPGCSRRLAPAQRARSSRARLKRRSPAAWSWHFFSRWCSGSTRASACNP
jgi:magnesium transporter